ncbi:glycosyltransferase family 4 protein [Sphaerochaeta halotolerans]|uniref:glycosyltransferase family 4 protein n=1 Tax=Sphaerochaeta halotolerans TaxID=2293840 RepID=UPI00136D3219|nr:glycosyltransferase family 4 protein [Sphaerochaeta halotolerans]MXI86049.1 glycosyltransferase [Sphaerochaeta halotolerans]
MPYHGQIGKVALVGNYIPRQCGIAVFTADLLNALTREQPDMEIWAAVINDQMEGYAYPDQVRFEINQRSITDYRLAADFLNINKVDIVCLQHEFGIFGGTDGAHIIELLENLQAVRVTVLHTVLLEPSPGQLAIIKRIGQLSDKIVVMSAKAKDILQQVYHIHPDKITIIPHGVPDVPFVDPYFYKDRFGLENRQLLLTFGLLSPNKGIETMIDALPRIVKEHPNVIYIVLGATHPHEKKQRGETYRLSLQRKARDLGVSNNILFDDRFVSLPELLEFMGAADVYISPYLNKEQITSGTLAYALGCGKATVSTPYWYAEELLGEGRGMLVPFNDTPAMADAVNELLANEPKRQAMRKKAYTYGRTMIWKEAARNYVSLFQDIKQHQEYRPKSAVISKILGSQPRELPQPKLDHIMRLTDDTGILQHANYIVPDRNYGYCTDDNARALIAVLMYQEVFSESKEITRLTYVYLSFLQDAFNEETGRFRNFMDYTRVWTEKTGSEDSHGRAVWALGEAASMCDQEEIRAFSVSLFKKALPAVGELTSSRAWAFSLKGLYAYQKRYKGDSDVRRMMELLSEKLFALYRQNSQENWPWVADTVTYANAIIPQAMIISGPALHQEEMLHVGLESLAWLVRIQRDPRGWFVPVGNAGWFQRGGEQARFDQQPIEAYHMIEACHEAYLATMDTAWLDHGVLCMEWFFGRNDLNLSLYNHTTGGCCDGLRPDGVNGNQGAESTLAGIMSLLNMHRMRSRRISAEVAVSDTNGR